MQTRPLDGSGLIRPHDDVITKAVRGPETDDAARTHARAIVQLQQMSGKTVIFQTAVAVVCLETGFAQMDLAPVKVRFRQLSALEIEAYLLAEAPYDCAGSAKSEGLGIALLEAIDNDDPTALVGLPLIRTCRMLQAAGVRVL